MIFLDDDSRKLMKNDLGKFYDEILAAHAATSTA
jgi:hypothetical protein